MNEDSSLARINGELYNTEECNEDILLKLFKQIKGKQYFLNCSPIDRMWDLIGMQLEFQTMPIANKEDNSVIKAESQIKLDYIR